MTNSQHVVCRYRYDALDVLVGLETGQTALQRFYRHRHLVTELRDQASQCVFQQDDQLLAVQSHTGSNLVSRLLVTDHQRSVLQLSDPAGLLSLVYSAYGHCPADSGFNSLLNFNGERPDPLTGHYLLGNGHRAFNPALMRFNSPDRLSPFGRGGLNAYAYCLGDPVNFRDPTGQFVDIAKILTSVGGLFNSVISLRPGIAFQVAMDALANGAVFRLPLRPVLGAVASVTAGVTGVGGAALGVASTVVSAINPASSLLEPAAKTALGLMAGSVAGRFVSWWAARNPQVVPALTRLARGSPVTGRPTTRASGSRRQDVVIEMGSVTPSAPPPVSPTTPRPSAPLQTPGTIGFEGFSFEQSSGLPDVSVSATNIRRRNSR
ncbi:RHS repeat-associated core domain-containing protein [Pseudomonas sp. LB3P31]